jgi:putative hydrolase of the HAD superfamily
MLQALTFDVTGTLIHSPRLGEIYAEILQRHGIPIEPDEARRLVGVVWRELACLADPSRDRFTSHPEGDRGWWRRFVERLCELHGANPPSRFAAAELFHRFGTAAGWEIYPEVPKVLAELREQGLRLGVISNWDSRLPGLLDKLGLARYFDAVTYSAAAGVEKPDRRIFLQALRSLGVDPGAALHIGDGRLEDVEGAIAAGLRALHLDRVDSPESVEREERPVRVMAKGRGMSKNSRKGAGKRTAAAETRRLRNLAGLPYWVTTEARWLSEGGPGSVLDL